MSTDPDEKNKEHTPTPLSVAEWAISREAQEEACRRLRWSFDRRSERLVKHYETCLRAIYLMLKAEATDGRRPARRSKQGRLRHARSTR